MTTGNATEKIRQALTQRARKSLGFAAFANDMGVHVDTLDNFLKGKSVPGPDLLNKLALDLFHGHCEFDAASNSLQSTNKNPATSLGNRPPQFKPKLPVVNTGNVPGPQYLSGPKDPPTPKRASWDE